MLKNNPPQKEHGLKMAQQYHESVSSFHLQKFLEIIVAIDQGRECTAKRSEVLEGMLEEIKKKFEEDSKKS